MEYKHLTTIGDKDENIGMFNAIDYILAFKNERDRRKAEQIMLEHRHDDDEISDTENMLNALNSSKIEYKIFENISEIWI